MGLSNIEIYFMINSWLLVYILNSFRRVKNTSYSGLKLGIIFEKRKETIDRCER